MIPRTTTRHKLQSLLLLLLLKITLINHSADNMLCNKKKENLYILNDYIYYYQYKSFCAESTQNPWSCRILLLIFSTFSFASISSRCATKISSTGTCLKLICSSLSRSYTSMSISLSLANKLTPSCFVLQFRQVVRHSHHGLERYLLEYRHSSCLHKFFQLYLARRGLLHISISC